MCSISYNILSTVFVTQDEHGKAKLILLDHGLYDYLNDRDRVSLCRLYKAIILHDDELMKRHSMELGVHGKEAQHVFLLLLLCLYFLEEHRPPTGYLNFSNVLLHMFFSLQSSLLGGTEESTLKTAVLDNTVSGLSHCVTDPLPFLAHNS